MTQSHIKSSGKGIQSIQLIFAEKNELIHARRLCRVNCYTRLLYKKVAPLTYDEARETECLYESLHVVGADVNHLAEDLVGGGAQLQQLAVHHQLKRARRTDPWQEGHKEGYDYDRIKRTEMM